MVHFLRGDVVAVRCLYEDGTLSRPCKHTVGRGGEYPSDIARDHARGVPPGSIIELRHKNRGVFSIWRYRVGRFAGRPSVTFISDRHRPSYDFDG